MNVNNVNNTILKIFLGLMVFLFFKTGVPGNTEIESPFKANEIIGQLDEISQRQLDYFLEIPSAVDTINRTNFFKPYDNESKEKIANLLMKAAEIEPDECHKKYLAALSYEVLHDRFHSPEPEWFTLEKNKTEIVFLPDETHLQQELWLKLLFHTFAIDAKYVNSGDEVFLSAIAPSAAASLSPMPHKIFDTFIFLNDVEETRRFEEYTQQFDKMEDNVPYKTMEKVVPFTRKMPPIKIAHLVYSSVAGRVSFIYPDRDVFYHHGQFKIVIFKNLIDAYVECIFKPLSEKILSIDQLKSVDIDSESYLSNLVMHKMAYHMGPLFLLQPKYRKINEREEDKFDRMGGREGKGFSYQGNKTGMMKGGKMQGLEGREIWFEKQMKGKNRDKDEMELKLISETLGDTFPVIEELKASLLSVLNTSILIEQGLIPREDELNIYATYVVSLVDRYRKNSNNPLNPAFALQLNQLIKKGAISFNINTQKLSINLSVFPLEIEKLAAMVIQRYQSPFQLLRGGGRTPELQAILSSAAEIPTDANINLNVKTGLQENIKEK